MRFTVRTESAPTPAHETMRVFVEGASAGLLTMRTTEAVAFKRAMAIESAAPDMLKALQSVLADVDLYSVELDLKAVHPETVKAVRAAVAKAQS